MAPQYIILSPQDFLAKLDKSTCPFVIETISCDRTNAQPVSWQPSYHLRLLVHRYVPTPNSDGAKDSNSPDNPDVNYWVADKQLLEAWLGILGFYVGNALVTHGSWRPTSAHKLVGNAKMCWGHVARQDTLVHTVNKRCPIRIEDGKAMIWTPSEAPEMVGRVTFEFYPRVEVREMVGVPFSIERRVTVKLSAQEGSDDTGIEQKQGKATKSAEGLTWRCVEETRLM